MGETSNKSAHARGPQTKWSAAKSVVPAAQDAPGSRDTFVTYLAQQLANYVGQRVLHLNAGAGALAQALLPRAIYVACADNSAQVRHLRDTLESFNCASACEVRAPFAEHLPHRADGYDTILWVRDTPFGSLDRLSLRHLRTALAPHGRILLLVAGAKEPFVAMDSVAEGAGLQLRQVRQFDRLGTPVAQAQRLMSRVGLGAPAQVLGDALRPFASRWDDRWPFVGRYALAVLVHSPMLAEAECAPEGCRSVRLRPKQPLS